MNILSVFVRIVKVFLPLHEGKTYGKILHEGTLAVPFLENNRVTVAYEIRKANMRVSPSGKALASQANIRGFESHHPLCART
jgi:hypothetical protein